MKDDKLNQEEELYVPTPKEVEMNRGKRRHQRITSESLKVNKAKRQQRRRKGFSISKRAAKRRTEASAPRPSKQDPIAQKGTDSTTLRSVDSSIQRPQEPKLKVVPEATDFKTPNTRTQRGSRIRTVRPKKGRPIAPPASEAEQGEPLKGVSLATSKAEKLGHKLKSWKRAPGYQMGRAEDYYTECKVCGRQARATLEELENYPDRDF